MVLQSYNTSRNERNERGERGAALIIVLGLVALISTWAVNAAYEDMLSLRRAENSQDAIRAEQASQSVLALSVKILREDSNDNQTDDLDEIWAQDSPPFPIDGGSVFGRIEDANRFLNLNALVDNNGKLVPEIEKQVKALFTLLDLDDALVDALIDWMDADDRPHGTGGAEDSMYYNQDYRVKNARLDRWQELRLIHGFDDKVVKLLASVAVVREMPASGFSPVNINTANAKVLMAIMPDMTAADAEAFIAERPFDSVAIALQNRLWTTGVKQAYLSVASDVFMVRTEAAFGRVLLREKFMLARQSGKITLLSIARAARDLSISKTVSAKKISAIDAQLALP
ncbi:MAG: type II secretion system minor pseudopilin GspK [Mariprofundus sp.]|nr:type II secretion system minor pseudopilin GspK [Mariprofundus sp.]